MGGVEGADCGKQEEKAGVSVEPKASQNVGERRKAEPSFASIAALGKALEMP